MSKSKISWTDMTWNPVVGCSKVSPGCDNCYAERMAWRLNGMAVKHHMDLVSCGKTGESSIDRYVCVTECGHWNGTTATDESALEKPLHWKKPRKIFVCSMGDLFHESVPFEFIDKVMAIIALCPQHTFQILTKRAERMKEYFTRIISDDYYSLSEYLVDGWFETDFYNQTGPKKEAAGKFGEWYAKLLCRIEGSTLSNLMLGVTAENQEQADKRIPLLLQTPAAKRFVSCEPMLGAIDIEDYITKPPYEGHYCEGLECGGCMEGDSPCDDWKKWWKEANTKLDLVICGGESGTGARPMHPDWARGLRDQCKAAGVGFHFKQWGEWVSVSEVAGPGRHYSFPDGATVRRVGKKKAGHLLDGVEHRPQF